jgi:hypothetical protein
MGHEIGRRILLGRLHYIDVPHTRQSLKFDGEPSCRHHPISLIERELDRRSTLAVLSMQLDGLHFSDADSAHTHVSV